MELSTLPAEANTNTVVMLLRLRGQLLRVAEIRDGLWTRLRPSGALLFFYRVLVDAIGLAPMLFRRSTKVRSSLASFYCHDQPTLQEFVAAKKRDSLKRGFSLPK